MQSKEGFSESDQIDARLQSEVAMSNVVAIKIALGEQNIASGSADSEVGMVEVFF